MRQKRNCIKMNLIKRKTIVPSSFRHEITAKQQQQIPPILTQSNEPGIIFTTIDVAHNDMD